MAHELKGASGTIGAPRVMTCAAEIEHRSRDGLSCQAPTHCRGCAPSWRQPRGALADYARAAESAI